LSDASIQFPPCSPELRDDGTSLGVEKKGAQHMAFMTSDMFRPATFRPGDALNQLKRSLRDLRPLAERGEGFDVHSQRVIEWRCDASFITVRLARRPACSPQWDTQVLKSIADVLKCVDAVKQRLARWTAG
jgi:hypothetical protein